VFSPIQKLAANATLSVTANPGGSPSINVTGIGVDPTHLIYNPDPVRFGSVFDGDNADATILVLNPAGAQTSGPITFAMDGGNPSCHFNVTQHPPGGPQFPCFTVDDPVAGDCISGTTSLAAGETCNIHVHFAPLTTIDDLTGFLDVTANPGNSPATHQIALSGTGLSTITIDPTFFDFGQLEAFSDFASETFTVTNVSDEPQNVDNIEFFGSADDLFEDDNCGSGLAPQGTCQVTVFYEPESRGEFDDAFLDIFSTNGFAQAEITGTSTGSGGGL